jgi:hypothetical protein
MMLFHRPALLGLLREDTDEISLFTSFIAEAAHEKRTKYHL